MSRFRVVTTIIAMAMLLFSLPTNTMAGQPTDGIDYPISFTTDFPGIALAARWSTELTQDITVAPVADRDHVFVGTGKGRFFAVDRATGDIEWSFSPLTSIRAPAMLWDDFVYVVAYDGNVYALDRQTGWLRWKQQMSSWSQSAPVVHDRICIASCYAGTMYGLDAANGRLMWIHSQGRDFIDHTVSVTDPAAGIIITTASGRAVRYDTGGNEVWSSDLVARPSSVPAICGSQMAMSFSGYGLYVFNTGTGEQLWSVEKRDNRWSAPAVGPDQVIAAEHDRLYVFTTSGRLQHEIELNAISLSGPVIAGRYVLVPVMRDDRGWIFLFDIDTEQRWFVPLSFMPQTPLTVTRDTVFVASNDRLYALSEISVIVDAWPLRFSGVWPFIDNGQLYVPIRQVMESVGASVVWDHDQQQTVIELGQHQVVLEIGRDNVHMINDRLIAPVRWVSESIGVEVNWDPALLIVTLKPPN